MALAATPPAEESAFGLALLLAAALHALLILGVGLEPRTSTYRGRPPTLDVVLVNLPEPKPAVPPARPDFLAQQRVEGGGDQPLDKATPRAAEAPPPLAVAALPQESPQPAHPAESPPAPPPEAPRAPVETPERAPDPRLVAEERQKTTELALPTPAQVSKTRITAAQILASRGEELAQVTAQLDRRVEAYASRERHKAISASTQEFKYAAYLDAWRNKVERVGNLNYPEEAKRRKIYGNLVLHVAVRADGSLDAVRVVQSSGSKVLDDAAVRIVRLAAPFAPFPPDIRAETDVLDITRTWQFLSTNRLGWEN